MIQRGMLVDSEQKGESLCWIRSVILGMRIMTLQKDCWMDITLDTKTVAVGKVIKLTSDIQDGHSPVFFKHSPSMR